MPHSERSKHHFKPSLQAALHKIPTVYLISSKPRGTLYVGVTSNLINRVWQHKQRHSQGFTSRYGIHRLVYFEEYPTMREAIAREKQIKAWRRAWKVRQIEETNPEWRDLWLDLTAE